MAERDSSGRLFGERAELLLRYPENWSSTERKAAVEDAIKESGLYYRFAHPGAQFGGDGFWLDLVISVAVGGAGGLIAIAGWEGIVATFRALRRLFPHGQLVVEAPDRPMVTYIFPEAAEDWTAAAAAIPHDYENYMEGEVTSRQWSPDGAVWEVTYKWKPSPLVSQQQKEPPPPPQVSPDGRFYWDGERWTPMQQQTSQLSEPLVVDALAGGQGLLDSNRRSPRPRGGSTLAGQAWIQSGQGELVLVQARMRLGCIGWFGVVITLGLSLIWWAAQTFTVTNQRVIMRRGVIWKTEQAIPLGKVQDVVVDRGPLSTLIRLTSAGGSTNLGFMALGPFSNAVGAEFARTLEAAREEK